MVPRCGQASESARYRDAPMRSTSTGAVVPFCTTVRPPTCCSAETVRGSKEKDAVGKAGIVSGPLNTPSPQAAVARAPSDNTDADARNWRRSGRVHPAQEGAIDSGSCSGGMGDWAGNGFPHVQCAVQDAPSRRVKCSIETVVTRGQCRALFMRYSSMGRVRDMGRQAKRWQRMHIPEVCGVGDVLGRPAPVRTVRRLRRRRFSICQRGTRCFRRVCIVTRHWAATRSSNSSPWVVGWPSTNTEAGCG